VFSTALLSTVRDDLPVSYTLYSDGTRAVDELAE
jgi:hypothetical protein